MSKIPIEKIDNPSYLKRPRKTVIRKSDPNNPGKRTLISRTHYFFLTYIFFRWCSFESYGQLEKGLITTGTGKKKCLTIRDVLALKWFTSYFGANSRPFGLTDSKGNPRNNLSVTDVLMLHHRHRQLLKHRPQHSTEWWVHILSVSFKNLLCISQGKSLIESRGVVCIGHLIVCIKGGRDFWIIYIE